MKKEDILASCIDEVRAGRCTAEECLTRHPDLRDELQPLLEIAARMPSAGVTPSPEFVQRTRNRLKDMVQPSMDAKPRSVDRLNWLRPLTARPRLSLAGALVVLVLVLGAGSAVVYASQGSLPGDALYGVKTTAEDVKLALTRSHEARASTHLNLADRRTEEVLAQSTSGRNISTRALESIGKETDGAIKEMAEMKPEDTKMLVGRLSESTITQQTELQLILGRVSEDAKPAVKRALDTAHRGNVVAQTAYGSPGFLSLRPSVFDEQLDEEHFTLSGTFTAVEGEDWNVSGLLVKGVNTTLGTPTVGDGVRIEGLVDDDQTFIGRIAYQEGAPGEFALEGILDDISPDGATWYVGGIPISRPQGTAIPPLGSLLRIVGTAQGGTPTPTSVESWETEEDGEDDEDDEDIETSGTLVEVDASQGTITIDVAGAAVTVNIMAASISNQDGQALSMSDLESWEEEIGDVEVSGLYIDDDALYARYVSVEIEDEDETDIEDEEKTDDEEETSDDGD
jgi:hypothetical protein